MQRIYLLLLSLLLAAPGVLPAQNGAGTAELIRSAMSAAPASVAGNATVVDHHGKVLRQGTNGWVCMPDNPEVPNNTPMCLDKAWSEFMDAYVNKRTPSFSGVGFGYMLQEDFPVSNTDPFATGPTPDNQWVANAGPHVMTIVSDGRMLEGLSTDPKNGGPWVMWNGTPYAHIMVPTEPRTR
jgi:hypothetical protein